MPSDFWWKNYKFCSIDAYFLILFFKGSKVICQRGKTFFFHQKSEGIAFTFCRYLNQNMRAFKFCRYCLQKYFLIPSNFDEKNTIVFWGQYPGNFETKFFPLRFEGILYNSVCHGYLFLSLKVSTSKKVWIFSPKSENQAFAFVSVFEIKKLSSSLQKTGRADSTVTQKLRRAVL